MTVSSFMNEKWKRDSHKNDVLGGTIYLRYKDTDFMIGAPRAHLHRALEILASYSGFQHRRVMNSVKKSIKNKIRRWENLTNKDGIELSQDVLIWFANEIFEGRKSFDDLMTEPPEQK